MTTRNSHIGRAALAVIAGATLTLGAAACSETEDAAKNATSAAGEAAASATSAAASAADSAASAASSAASSAESAVDSATSAAMDDMSEVKTADGQTVKVPEDIKNAWEKNGGETGAFGALKSVSQEGEATLATFEKGWMTYSKETGAVPLIGKIGETWGNGGALKNPIGLPTAPETGDAVKGWTQEFQKGTITWADNGSGTYAADVKMK